MPPRRRCLHCGAALNGGPQQQFCSDAHRKQHARSKDRKLVAAQRQADRVQGEAPGSISSAVARNDDIAALIGRKREDVIREAFVDELRPVVREAIDNDAIRAIQGMVALAPSAVLVLEQDLQSNDPLVRSKAAAMVVKYTLGNPNVAPPRQANDGGLTIINHMPDAVAPAVDDPAQPEAIVADATEVKRCDTCRLDKPVDDFPAGGPRCQVCLDDRKAAVEEAFGIPSDNAVLQPSPAADVQRQGGERESEVGQARSRLQSSDLRTAGMDERRFPDPPETEAGRTTPRPPEVRRAPFAGPRDPNRWSPGEN